MENKTNREIKFRAWDKEKKIMCHVDLMRWNPPAPEEGWNPKYIKLLYPNGGYSRQTWVGGGINNNFAIMQYTGLKDENGVEVYEGDIVKIGSKIMSPENKHPEYWGIKEVQFGGTINGSEWTHKIHGWCLHPKKDDYDLRHNNLGDDDMILEVLGNIYEDNNLLEE